MRFYWTTETTCQMLPYNAMLASINLKVAPECCTVQLTAQMRGTIIVLAFNNHLLITNCSPTSRLSRCDVHRYYFVPPVRRREKLRTLYLPFCSVVTHSNCIKTPSMFVCRLNECLVHTSYNYHFVSIAYLAPLYGFK